MSDVMFEIKRPRGWWLTAFPNLLVRFQFSLTEVRDSWQKGQPADRSKTADHGKSII